MTYRSILESVRDGGHIYHIRGDGRTVAIRRGYTYGRDSKPNGRVNLTFSDNTIDLRLHGDTLNNLTISQAERAIHIFLTGQRIQMNYGVFPMLINQGRRICNIVELTRKRVRLSYDMPNRGTMGGWWKYVEIGHFHYLTNH